MSFCCLIVFSDRFLSYSFVSRLKFLLQYLRDGGDGSPYATVRETKRLASTVTAGEHGVNKLEIVGDDGDCAIQDGNKLSIQDVSVMLHKMRLDLLETVRSDVLYNLDTSWLSNLLSDEGSIRLDDNWHSDDVGYNFVKANTQLEHHRNELVAHLLRNKGSKSIFVKARDPGGNPIYNTLAMVDYLSLCDQCFLKFATALHISAGEPMRGDEYQSLNIINTPSGDRSFLWSQSHKTFFVWQTYFKSEGSGQAINNVLRLIAPDWLEIFFILEVLVRPAMAYVASKVWPDDNDKIARKYQSSWLLRRGEPVTGQQFSLRLSDAFVEYVGFPVGLAQWRHWAVHFGEFVQKKYGSGGVLLPLDEQAGHSAQTAADNYALTKNDLRGLNRHMVKAYSKASQAWHIVFGCDSHRQWPMISTVAKMSEHVSKKSTLSANAELNEVEVNQLSMALPCVKFVAVPVPYTQVGQPHLAVRRPEHPSAIEDTILACNTMKRLGYVDWTCDDQAFAAAVVVENRQSIGVILPTGAGKSILFQIPSILFPPKIFKALFLLTPSAEQKTG